MRRGLIAWSKAELPEAVFDARLARLRAQMAAQNLDAMLVYTNNTRTAGVSWLTAFVPYWAEGLLVVPRAGDPLLTMAFSNRIVGWGKEVSRVARFEGGARPGQAAGIYLAELKAGTVGVADFDGLRQAVATDLAEAAPAASFVDATAAFRQARAPADPAEIALMVHAGAIAHHALNQITGREEMIGDALGAVEAAARLGGAEEVYLAAAPDLSRSGAFARIEGAASLGAAFAVRATVAYKGSWVRMTRTIDKAPEAAAAQTRAADIFAAAIAGLPRGDGFTGFRSWAIEGCRVAQPLEALMGASIAEPATPAAGSLVIAQGLFEGDGRRIALAAPVLVGAEGFPSAILVQPHFDPR
jgi:hypothetical protein